MSGRLLRGSLALLVLVALAASIARAAFPADLARRLEPWRERLLERLALAEPRPDERAREVARFDAPFASHRAMTRLHVVAGGLFLLLAPMQLAEGIRRRHPRLHRRLGRLLVGCGALAGLTGLYFGLLMPFAGPAEAAAIALFGGLFLAALWCAFLAIRRGDVARHREWMVRAFALAIAVSTVRVLGGILDLTLSPRGVSPRAVFAIAVWSGWTLSLALAELWIRSTRPRAQVAIRGQAPFPALVD